MIKSEVRDVKLQGAMSLKHEFWWYLKWFGTDENILKTRPVTYDVMFMKVHVTDILIQLFMFDLFFHLIYQFYETLCFMYQWWTSSWTPCAVYNNGKPVLGILMLFKVVILYCLVLGNLILFIITINQKIDATNKIR